MSAATLFPAYQFAYFFWFSISAGCFVLLMLHHATRGAWSLPIQRVFEAGTKTLIVMAVLFLVILFGLPYLYPWADPARVHADAVLTHKAGYLNPIGFAIRSLVTFLIWGVFAFVTIKSSERQAKSLDIREAGLRASWGAPGIVMFALTGTMTYTDWIMSRDPHWYSTIFPALLMVGQALSAIAFAILFVTNRVGKEPYSSVVTPKLTRDMGNLTLTCTMLWAYFTFSQYVIIWSGNLPEEAGYFHKRLELSWNWLGMLVVIGQFFAPFLLLLSGRTKRTVGYIRAVAIVVLVARFLDLYWNMAPFSLPETVQTTPITAAAPFVILWLIVGAIWYASFEFFRKQASELPTYDARLELVEAGQHA